MNYWVNIDNMCMKYHEYFLFAIIFRFPHLLLYFCKSFRIPNWGIIQLFQLWNKHYFVDTQYVDAGIKTLVSISDGLCPSIFCRETERTGPMREAMDGKVVYFPPESAFRLWCFNNVSTFPFCTLTWRVNNYVSRQGEGINRRNESTKTEGLLLFRSTDDIIQYC